ncbi:Glycosyltransferase, catalytic subunit of cellulose synthase and poly-beta-1,6-N-acetylglucosamine synthase [Leifsonia sp. 98AMF]|uniref:glycosyltransferase family 2 protein n=1 Tax=unclassified Leifsonia TaxID=2663824 RepID=UPI00087CC1F0|nr:MULTISPECIES: glycosyltransferase family 2 protein [unclassified Leifsonia]SDH27621.1 Glycosyltransferase, catalytic subunit of cellulose synthase and poly-beta-1,6-N-acetylglucosamine synthase [Leifsonia sp. 197AMF]SDJ10925.1 Glycosyltransferase, catalytic subunit of cellulose synthase and poly-beta-1,6-N-acetylglucosamine synthase [Leifsonia sp. 466MF]SDJ59274.1 Glycosyltransferase, catalytic subunit of cellulose synthase and poly-beta-1,6-N-acetylglucosamine synthase [Leifsonia sp. 157MF]
MPDDIVNTLPGVSYVMPVLNEVTHVRAAVDSLLAQDYAGPFEVTIALGPSMDGTTQLVEELAAVDSRIRVVDNVVGSTPAGLNLAIRESQYPIVIRVDAHSVLPPDYARVAVETILETGADNVGGLMDAQGTTDFERAVARAYGSRVGLGGTKLHVGGEAGPAETVYLGVFRRDRLIEVGLFDEEIKRGQDWELNRRLRTTGGTVWFTPRLKVTYRPRPNLYRLARQFFSTGIWRGELARRFPASNGLRYFAPPVMVVGVAVGTVLGIVGIIQALLGAAPWLLWGFAIPALYVVIVVVSALLWGRRDGFRPFLWFLVVLPCIHFSWGIGFVLGYLSLTRNITAHTGR